MWLTDRNLLERGPRKNGTYFSWNCMPEAGSRPCGRFVAMWLLFGSVLLKHTDLQLDCISDRKPLQPGRHVNLRADREDGYLISMQA